MGKGFIDWAGYERWARGGETWIEALKVFKTIAAFGTEGELSTLPGGNGLIYYPSGIGKDAMAWRAETNAFYTGTAAELLAGGGTPIDIKDLEMTDQLQRLRDEIAGWIAKDEAEIIRLNDRASDRRHILARLDDAIRDSVMASPSEIADETARRREKRDIRGAVLAVLQECGPHEAPVIKTYVERKIGELTDSALARSLSSLVGDSSIIERDGVFWLPGSRPLSEAAK